MHCAITAGGRPKPDDPLYAYTQGQAKAFLDMGGRTMLERVIDGLQSSRYVEDIVVVGLSEEEGKRLKCSRPVSAFLPDQGSLFANTLAGVKWVNQFRPGSQQIILSSADIPLISGPILDNFIESCQPFDRVLYYTMVSREVMEKRFPNSKRTFVRLKDAEIAGGDIFLAQTKITDTNHELWKAATNARKHAWQLARIVGFWTLFKYLTRQLSLAEIEATGSRMLKAPVKIILSPHAELGMDGDKPHQVDLLRSQFNAL